MTCQEEDSAYDLCVIVQYPDTDGSHDFLLVREKEDASTVLTGHLKYYPKTKVVVILADEDNAEDTVSKNETKVTSNCIL